MRKHEKRALDPCLDLVPGEISGTKVPCCGKRIDIAADADGGAGDFCCSFGASRWSWRP